MPTCLTAFVRSAVCILSELRLLMWLCDNALPIARGIVLTEPENDACTCESAKSAANTDTEGITAPDYQRICVEHFVIVAAFCVQALRT